MSVDMPAGNCNIDPCFRINLHALREVGHATEKVLRPLTADIVCDKNPRQYDADQRGKNYKINATIPKGD